MGCFEGRLVGATGAVVVAHFEPRNVEQSLFGKVLFPVHAVETFGKGIGLMDSKG